MVSPTLLVEAHLVTCSLVPIKKCLVWMYILPFVSFFPNHGIMDSKIKMTLFSICSGLITKNQKNISKSAMAGGFLMAEGRYTQIKLETHGDLGVPHFLRTILLQILWIYESIHETFIGIMTDLQYYNILQCIMDMRDNSCGYSWTMAGYWTLMYMEPSWAFQSHGDTPVFMQRGDRFSILLLKPIDLWISR